MEEKVNDKILIRIKKMLSLSKQRDNENEAATAAAMVQELLLRYNLSHEELEDVQTEKEEKYSREFSNSHMQGRRNVPKWKVDLADEVANGNLCKIVIYGKGTKIEWLGKPSNIEVAKYLWETLCSDLERICDDKWEQIDSLRKLAKEYNVDVSHVGEIAWVHGKSWKNSFYVGAVHVIGRRLREGLRNLKTEANLNALVTTSDQQLALYMKSIYPKLGHGYRGSSSTSSSGYMAGREAGQHIQFKTGVGSGGSYGPKLIRG